jgi:hypothetical protein
VKDAVKELIYTDHMVGAIKWDGFDDAIVGTATIVLRKRPTHVLVYSPDIMREILQEGGMSREDADEYIQFNIATLWAGDRTPILLDSMHLNVMEHRP